ncbi:zinc finger protein 501-like isoform X2 [Neoarius graeffei]|uniref:zinc finger protein 501-like isoform X2 n=1 Tax=Neoarius graeffei TaxID=443677 RepID=UPI00298CB8E5|nr:zinc finger protein 501-like isoform X2 [Neoarius graeffei]
MMEEECVDGGGDAVLQLHLPCNPLFSCTVSVGTDLSMADISDLHAEVCELRKTVRHLEERLSQALNLSNQVMGSTPALYSVCKADLNPSEVRVSEHTAEWPGFDPHKREFKCEEDELSTSVHLYSDPNPTESHSSPHTPLKTFNGEEQHTIHTPLRCSVTLVDCRAMVEMNGDTTQEEDLHDGSVHAEEPEQRGDTDEDLYPSSGFSEEEDKFSSVKPKEKETRKKMCILCNICGKSLSSAAFLKRHIDKHKTNLKEKVPRSHMCPLCGKGFLTLSALKEHAKTHRGEKPFCCDECGNRFTTKGNLKSHQSIHTGHRPFQCSYCEKRFYHKMHVKVHERVHTKEKPYMCSICEKGFITITVLKQHQKVHSSEKSYQCSHCEMMFKQKINLRWHEQAHLGEKPFLCEHCGKGFSHPATFSAHKRTHIGGTHKSSFRCSVCGKTFLRQYGLKQHERIHTKDRPYSCSYCTKTFARPDVLRTHLRIHTGEKPYHCSICDQGFTYLGSFRAHQKNHTQENVNRR